MPNILKTMESLPFIDDLDGKKGTYEKYMESVVSGSKQKSIKKTEESTFDRRAIVSRSTIRSPREQKGQKRKLKLTDSERKQVNKDLMILQKATPSDRYDSNTENEFSNHEDISRPPTTERDMDIHYPPDFDEEPKKLSNKGKLTHRGIYQDSFIFIELISPDPFAANTENPVDFSQNMQEPPSIRDIDPKNSKKTTNLPSETDELKDEINQLKSHPPKIPADSVVPNEHPDSHRNLPTLSNPDENMMPKVSEEKYVSSHYTPTHFTLFRYPFHCKYQSFDFPLFYGFEYRKERKEKKKRKKSKRHRKDKKQRRE